MNFKKQTATILSILLLTSMIVTTLLSSIPATNAQTSGEMVSFAFLTVAPNPVGRGQTTYISMWIDIPVYDASEANNIRRHNYKLTITDPDGGTETKTWDVVADTTGVQSTAFTPAKIGTYTLTFEYPEQIYTWNATATQQRYYGLRYLATNTTITLTVQEDPIKPTPDTPLPEEYWSRPIFGQNWNWYTIASHWLGASYLGTFQQNGYNLWQQSGTGPESSHILWTHSLESGGVVGGENTGTEGATYYSGGSYEGRFVNALIIDGRLYFKPPQGNSNGGPYTCLDLKTGEVLWTNPDINPTFGQLYSYESPNQHGVLPSGYLWQMINIPTNPNIANSPAANQTWMAFDPKTSGWLFNLTGVPIGGTVAYTEKGEIVKYFLNYNTQTRTGSLSLWNWTAAKNATADITGAGGTNALQFRPINKNIDCSEAFSWNVTINADLTGSANPAIAYVLPGDVIFGTSSALTAGTSTSRGTPDPHTVWTLNIEDGRQGELLWKQSYPAPPSNMTRTLGPLDPVNRVWTLTDAETMQWLGYDLRDGKLLWGPTTIEVPAMQYFSSGSGANQRAVTAYGNLYTQGFGGEINCINTTNGAHQWRYNNTNSGIDTGWGHMPTFINAIADGKVYAFNNEHSPASPLYKGYSIYCINAYTGEEIYKMLSWAGQTGGTGTSTSILADGSLTYYNYYDNQLYCVAKGPTKTTISAPNLAATAGQSVVISGTVTDISAGTNQHEQAARFPNGVPAASDASMSAWMEYVYMGQSKPTNFIGVEVKISVIDANNNHRVIGTATTNSDGFYSHNWIADITGTYTVIATFEGTGGLYGSNSNSAFAVDGATPTQPPPTDNRSVTDQYFIPAVIGIIIAIIIVGLATIFSLRKKP